MGDVSPVLRGSGSPRGSREVGQQLQRGRREAVMAERGKEQLAVVLLCLFFHMSALKRETQDVDGWVCVTKKSSSMSVCVCI